MADVYAIFGTLLALGIAFPGFLTAWWLLFPNRVEAARARIESTPWKTFGLGLLVSAMAAGPILLLFAVSLPFTSFLGALLTFSILAFAALGAAGIVSQMASHLKTRADENMSASAAFVRAAVALELAAAFPIIGWFILMPLCILASMGAAVFGLLGWMPKPRIQADIAPIPAKT